MPRTAIQAVGLNKWFGEGEARTNAVNNVSFEAYFGEMLYVVGPSGSGKTTMLSMISGILRPNSGTVKIEDTEIWSLSSDDLAEFRLHKIGFVFQSFFLLARSNALQNVMLPLFYRGTPREEAQKMAINMLEKVGVAHLAHHRPNQLSGGQQQRVAIARALVGDPEVILADEPTGALDSQTGNEVMALLTSLNENEGRTIMIITHDKEISRRCRRIVTIKDGKIL